MWKLSILLLISAELAFADIYKYTDNTGSVCMTNNLESVPKKYRAKMTVIKEESHKSANNPLISPKSESVSRDNAAIVSQEQESVNKIKLEKKSRYIQTAVTAALIFASFIGLRWLGGLLGVRGAGTALFLIVTIIGGVYLYKLYIVELSAVFSTLKKDAMNIKGNVETREKQTDQMLKLKEEKESKE